MKKIILGLLSAFIGASCMIIPQAAEPELIEIYVSPDGKDTNPGTKEQPLANVDAAVSAVVKAKSSYPDAAVDVIFAGGEYVITKSVSIPTTASGKEGAEVTFKAQEGETPVFTGAIELDIDKFTKITDMKIYERLPKVSRDKVGEINLKDYGITKVGSFPNGRTGSTNSNYYQLYLDGERQTLAQWPNVGYEKIDELVDKNNSVFRPKGIDITRWGTANESEICIGGFLNTQYAYDRTHLIDIDVKERTIRISKSYPISGTDRRYFLFNFLEELDAPGEWYINKETMMLYYYPEHKLSNERLEISTLTSAMINMTNVSYFTFDGITFTKTCNDVINYARNKHFTVKNCTFDECGRSGIEDTQSSNMRYYYDEVTDLSHDILIDSNIFTDLGAVGVAVTGGEYYTLTPGNVKVTNNYFARYALDWKNYSPAVDVVGVGCEVYNNTIHDSPGNGIQTHGNDHKVMYNEIYEILKDVHDAGGIYEGRSSIRRGTEFAYNYYHDLEMTDRTIGDMVCGLYMDDGLCEWNIHHNIFDNCIRAVFMGGGDYSTVENNIFIDCPTGPSLGFYINESRKSYIIEALDYKAKYPAYRKYYIDDDLLDVVRKGCRGNKINNNLLVNSVVEMDEAAYSQNNEAVGNITYNTKEEAGFRDFATQNYEINPESETAKALPGLLDIDMSKIGISKEMWERVSKKPMLKYMPANGEMDVPSSKVTFGWEGDNICDTYVFTLATDDEMKNVVYQGTARYNYITLENVVQPGNKVYYWNVYGLDSSKMNFDEVQSVGAPYRFVTSAYDEINKLFLNEEIAKADAILKELSVGTEMGQCTQETIDEFNESYKKAFSIQRIKYSTQAVVDGEVKELQQAIKDVNAKRNKGFENLDEYIRNATWRYDGSNSEIHDGILYVKDKVAYMDSTIPGYKIMSFQMKPDAAYSMIAVTLRLKQAGIIWQGGAGGDGYTVIIKPKLIEYQRYKSGAGGILKTVDNLYLKAGEWNDIEVGCVAYKDGIKTILRINGHEVLNEYDDSKLITDEGGLQFENFNFSAGKTLEVRGAQSVSEFKESVVTGKLDEVTPVVAEINSLTTENKDGITTVSGLSGNELINADVVFNSQSIGLRNDGTNEYKLNVTEDKLELIRITEEGEAVIISDVNNKVPVGEKINITLGAYPCSKGMRIMLYKGNEKIIDYVDSYSKHSGTDIKIYNDSNGKFFN